MSLRPPPHSALADLDANCSRTRFITNSTDSKQFIAELRIPAHFRRHALVVAGTQVTNETTISFDHLLQLAKQGDKKALEALRGQGEVSGRRNRTLVAGLAPDMIVTVGEVTQAWHQVGPIIMDTVRQASFMRAETQIVPSDPTTQPRLRGTIAFVLLQHFGARPILLWSRTNWDPELRKPSSFSGRTVCCELPRNPKSTDSQVEVLAVFFGSW